MAIQEVRVTLPVGEHRIHRFQVVRESRENDSHEDWIVVDFPPDGIKLASIGFDWSRTVPTTALEDGPFEPLMANGVPVWGY